MGYLGNLEAPVRRVLIFIIIGQAVALWILFRMDVVLVPQASERPLASQQFYSWAAWAIVGLVGICLCVAIASPHLALVPVLAGGLIGTAGLQFETTGRFVAERWWVTAAIALLLWGFVSRFDDTPRSAGSRA